MVLLAVMVKTPISVTNLNLGARLGLQFPGRGQIGFTLIELLVVIAIAALLVAIVPTSLERLRDGGQYRDTVRSLLTDLRQARQGATMRNQDVLFSIDLTARSFGIRGRAMTRIPENLQIRTTVATDVGEAKNHSANILFLAGGGATGGSIELIRASGSGVKITVDWLTGKVMQEPF